MGTTDTPDTPAESTIVLAADKMLIMSAATGRGATKTADFFTPVSGPTRIYNTGTSSLGALTGIDTNGRSGVQDTMWFWDIFVPYPCVILGAAVLNGTTVGTTKAFTGLYTAAGALVANSSVTGGGAVTANASVFQERLYTTAYTAKPGRYWMSYHPDGTNATVRTIVAATYVHVNSGSAAGVAATASTSLTPVTTFTANLAIVSYLYTA